MSGLNRLTVGCTLMFRVWLHCTQHIHNQPAVKHAQGLIAKNVSHRVCSESEQSRRPNGGAALVPGSGQDGRVGPRIGGGHGPVRWSAPPAALSLGRGVRGARKTVHLRRNRELARAHPSCVCAPRAMPWASAARLEHPKSRT